MKKAKSIFLSLVTVVIAVAVIFTIVKAGNLEPTSEPAATFYTLSDIYTRLTTNATSTEGDHLFSPSAEPASSMYTLKQIYEAIPTIVANTVKLGTSYLGVDGTLTPDGGTATVADLFKDKTTYIDADWTLDTGTLEKACYSTGSVSSAYANSETDRYCIDNTDAGTLPSAANQVYTGKGYWTGSTWATGTAACTETSAPTASIIKSGESYCGTDGTLTPDGGTAGVADLFNNKTAHLTADWNLDTGTLDLACNTATFDGSANKVADDYDGAGNGNNRWCMTDSGDAAAGDIVDTKKAWVDGVEITGTLTSYPPVTGDGWAGLCVWKEGDVACDDANFPNKHTRVVCDSYGYVCTCQANSWQDSGCSIAAWYANEGECNDAEVLGPCEYISASETSGTGLCASSTTYTYCCQ